jgi:ATP-dependent helicase/nuclease subunit B
MKTLLIGPAGSGKTHLILSQFENALRSNPDPLRADSYFLLPSAEHTERVITVILQRGLKGFFNRRVTTLTRLIRDVFNMGDENVISNSARFLMMRDILESRTWEPFEEVQHTRGFLDLILHFIIELKESVIDVKTFRERLNSLKKFEPDLAVKYEALAALYETYEAKMRDQGLSDRHDLLARYRQRKEKGAKLPSFKKIWLDGFFDFTNLQFEYLKELSERCEEITITLTKDPGLSRESLFDTATRTEKMLVEAGFKVEKMGRPLKRTAQPALQFLEENLFKDAPSPYPSSASERGSVRGVPDLGDTIQIFEAVGVQGEVEMMAREIDRLYRLGGYRYSDFAILLRSIGSYESIIRSVFSRYEIPFELHERERLKLSPLVHVLSLLLKIFREGWKREDLINFFKSSYVTQIQNVPKDYEWVSRLEHAAFREGILEGRENWLKNSDDKALIYLASLEDRFRAAKSHYELKQLFSDVFSEFGIFEVRDLDPSQITESVRRDAASVKRIEALLDEIRIHARASGRAELTFEEFSDQLLRLIELDLYSLHNHDRNRVQIYDVSLARQKEYKVVFVAGLLEKQFPMHIKEDPILSDWERSLFNQGALNGLAERLPRQNLERYLFYIAVTRTSEKLILTCPRFDLEGKESLPSFYLDEVRSLFNMQVTEKKQDLAHPFPGLRDAISLRELEMSVTGQLYSAEETDSEKKNLLLYLTNSLLTKPTSQSKLRFAANCIVTQLVDPAILSGDFFRTPQTSPTSLEMYSKCSFRYFAEKILKLQDPEEEINIKQKGSIRHRVLELYFKHIRERGGFPSREESRKFILRELDRAMEKYPLQFEKKYQRELDYENLKDNLLRFIEFEITRLEQSPFQPHYFEFGFGVKDEDREADSPALELETDSGPILIRGKIDRIDVDPANQYALVIDYKSSAKYNREAMEMGTALQLPIYIMVAEKYLGLKPVGGQLYSLKDFKAAGFYHKENMEKFQKLAARSLNFSESEFRSVIEHSAEQIREFVGAMRKAEIAVRPRSKDACDFCSYSAVCRIEKWRVPLIVQEIKDEKKKSEIRNPNLETNSKDQNSNNLKTV